MIIFLINYFVQKSIPPIQGVFYDGEIFDAYNFVTQLIKNANKSIVVIDNYVDESVLTMLDKRKNGVTAIIYTDKINKQLQLDIKLHNSQYPTIDVFTIKNCHDRFIIIDDEEVFLFGASLKDLGKKLFAFSKLYMSSKILLDKLVKNKTS